MRRTLGLVGEVVVCECFRRGGEGMRRLVFWLSVILVSLTFVGAGYVLWHHGRVNAGYAAVPMALALASIAFYRGMK